MQLDIYTDIESIQLIYKKMKELRSEEELSDEGDVIADFLRFLGKRYSCLFFSKTEDAGKMELIISFLRIIADNKPRDLVRFENRFFTKLERSEDLRSVFGSTIGLAFLNMDTKTIYSMTEKFQILFLNPDILSEKWKKLAQKDEERYPRIISVNSNCGFNWDKIATFKEATSRIILCDRQMFNMDERDYKGNIIPLINSLLPGIKKFDGKIKLILIGARDGSGPSERYIKGWQDPEQLLVFLKNELSVYDNVSITLGALDHRKVHDRLVFTDYFSFDVGHCFNILHNHNKTVKANINTTFKVNGVGLISSFLEIKKQYEEQKNWYNDELKNNPGHFYGAKKSL